MPPRGYLGQQRRPFHPPLLEAEEAALAERRVGESAAPRAEAALPAGTAASATVTATADNCPGLALPGG